MYHLREAEAQTVLDEQEDTHNNKRKPLLPCTITTFPQGASLPTSAPLPHPA
jgi:hypothetical protein